MKRTHRLIFFTILSFLLLSFIFSNSLQSGEESNAISGGVSLWLKPILDPFDRMPEDRFHYLVRKLAHFTEFAALGMSLTGVALNLKKTSPWLMPVLWALLAACADETIQRFTGRTCAWGDVCIDFSGAIVGRVLVYGVRNVWKHFSGKWTGDSGK